MPPGVTQPASAPGQDDLPQGRGFRSHNCRAISRADIGAGKWKGFAMYWPLNDAHLVLLVLSYLAVITVGSLVSALTRVRRAEFSRLQDQVKQLSEKVKALEIA